MIDSSDQLETLNPYVSRETIKKLSDYRDSIISAKFNLVSKKDKDHIWIRHFHDSLRLTKFFEKVVLLQSFKAMVNSNGLENTLRILEFIYNLSNEEEKLQWWKMPFA